MYATRTTYLAAPIIALTAALLMTGSAAASDKAAAKKAPGDAELIASAMRAAPAGVAKGATIIAMSADGSMRTLRKGTNDYTCMPDNPETPGPDPMCMDKNAMEWAQAWMSHKPPPAGKMGVMYMLSGGTDASNTDPYATKPDASNHWIKTGPHIMVVGSKEILAGHPSGAKPETSVPYVMWAGTPYAHLMVPVKGT